MPEKRRAVVGDDVTALLRGRLIAYDDELGHWTLRTDGSDHVPWEITLHWDQPFEIVANEQSRAKWVVADAVLSPDRGNGVWFWSETLEEAAHALVEIYELRYRISMPEKPTYVVPACGLGVFPVVEGEVCRG